MAINHTTVMQLISFGGNQMGAVGIQKHLDFGYPKERSHSTLSLEK